MLILYILISFNIMINFVMISSVYWFPSWVMMELTGFTFMMILSFSRSESIYKKICTWKYFFFQCIGSLMFLISMFVKLNQINFYNSLLVNMVLMAGLLMKLGLPPFHKWSFEVSENLDWFKFLLINSIQKIPAIILTWKLADMDWMVILSFLFSMLFSFMNIFDWSLRRFLMYSSIMNFVWIMLCSMLDSMSMLMYLMIYLMSFTGVVKFMSKFSFSCFSFLFSNNMVMMIGPSLMIIMSMNILSMSGMPPLAGFLAKYEVVMCFINNNFILLSLIITLSSMILLLMYIIMLIGSLTPSKVPGNWMNFKDIYISMISVLNLLFPFMYFF